ncbi:MAG TPA: Hsp20/alpha crystallin family protein [Cytophagaceae bacterium]|jgi:HSP20 family protein|nr:Hsp20/alpha crystallin family protein [Cytophagaceae bacterium]
MNTVVKSVVNNGRFVPRTYSDLLDGFLKDSFLEGRSNKFLPSADIAEDEKGYYLSLAIPGINKEEVSIELNEGILSISGEKKLEKEENGKKYHTIESYYGTFKRSFKLPENVKSDTIEAEYKDGMLNVTVPKDEKKALKSTIQIK